MKLTAYPQSKVEPAKIVSTTNNTVLFQVYSDGSISFNGSMILPYTVNDAVLIRDSFCLFYEKDENVNVNSE